LCHWLVPSVATILHNLLSGRISLLCRYVTDGVEWFVGRSVTILSPAKMAELIEVLFGLWTQVGLRNHVLDGVQIPMWRGSSDGGKHYLHGRWLAERARSTILLQRNLSIWRNAGPSACWTVTKCDIHILWSTLSVYKLFECPSSINWFNCCMPELQIFFICGALGVPHLVRTSVGGLWHEKCWKPLC